MSTRLSTTTPVCGILLLLGGCASMPSGSPEPPSQAAPAEIDVETELAGLEAPAAGTVSSTAAPVAAAVTPEPDFWQQLRDGFRLPGQEHPSVLKHAARYGRSAALVERTFRRGEPYLAYIQGEVEKRGFPTEITLLPFVESSYDPFAYSHGRAAGLWQFIPGTGRLYGLRQDWWYDGRRDIVASTRAALTYLDWLQQEFNGDWLLALAAYNSGSGTVRKAIRKNREAGRPIDFWHLELPRETSSYVPKLLAISRIVEHPQNYGVELLPIDKTPEFAIVETGGQIDIGIAAELAGLDVDEIYALNPGFNRWATHPDGPHHMLLPAASADVFEANLEALPESKRVKWVRHRVRSGETLSHIARRYDTTVSVVRSSNGLRGDTIRSGSHLLVPVAAKDLSHYAALERSARQRSGTRGGTRYRVQSGDSLWVIARRHGVTADRIAQWNGLKKNAVIRPGQTLVIRGGSAAGAGQKVRTVRYTVRKGDSLFLISRKFNVSVADLRSWNDLHGQKYLQPGQRLKVHVDVSRQSVASQG